MTLAAGEARQKARCERLLLVHKSLQLKLHKIGNHQVRMCSSLFYFASVFRKQEERDAWQQVQ